ncbi:malto-oligosyltrehalose synthase [Xanthobacter flavus]|uniref:malto-oligosyltrehalose synthase n=1 Tax=Xanthobacter flavus TaxID=281 RepID=UPI003726AF6F
MTSDLPRATYRLQFHKGFTFDHGAAVVPYLADLGISHLYASPILKARAGSTHCYDVVDPAHVNPELGGEESLRRLVAALRGHGMGLVVDIVPNHMGVGGDENPYWLDVLRHGPDSPFAPLFDIDFAAGGGRLLAPFLGAPYHEVLAAGDLKLVRDPEAGWAVRYFHHLFPLRPEDAEALEADPAAAGSLAGEEAAGHLHALLERQHYRLAYWRTAPDTINWRRFFDVTELAALRADAPGVFERTHAKVLDLYAEGLIDGLRVDHVDGLADPGAYCRRLRAELSAREALRPAPLRGRAWLVVEKILAAGESLDPGWEVDGTTGYDFMEEVSRLLHDAAGFERLTAHWAARTGRPAAFSAEEEPARREIIARSFTAPLESAVDALAALAAADLADRDRPRPALRRCLIEILVHFPRYRTYAAGTGETGADALHGAITAARGSVFPGDAWHLDRIGAWLGPLASDAPHRDLRRVAITRFEQLSSPVAAKSVEDTAFYRYGPLLSRNEVGSNPATGGGGVADWHRTAAARAERWPFAMLASATHDHKRGEDVRARLSILSECADLWIALLDRWLAALKGQAPTVDAADRIMLIETLVGAWPDDASGREDFLPRIEGWQMKALREAKRATSWDRPDEAFEAEAQGLARFILTAPEGADMRREISRFVDLIRPAAEAKGLVASVLKLTAPGIPDFYQGTEFLDLSLVDPDNRRPVDFARRRAGLDAAPEDADARKQHLIRTLLRLRADEPELFRGDYVPLDVGGTVPMARFLRTGGGKALLVACPVRTFEQMTPAGGLQPTAWQGIKLPDGFRWRFAVPGLSEPVPSATDLAANADWPFALLVGERG